MTIEIILLWVAVLMFASVVSSKLSDRFAIPALILFLFIGMLAGSEGIGGIYFDNLNIAKSMGIVALIFIIFSGGLDTDWSEVKPILWPGLALSTAGILITAVIIGVFAMHILHFTFLEGLLLGSIVSSTDAAAVFSILRSRKIGLKNPLKPLLEFESGSNDPMAVFLTVGFISILTNPDLSRVNLLPRFFQDMGGGILIGFLMARLMRYVMINLKLDFEGLYHVLMISLVLLTYAAASFLKCNGFLAVYVAGLIMAHSSFPHKKMITRFHDALAWLMQIAMFLTLGLLVFPSNIIPVMGVGFLIAFILMVIARPTSVLICLLPFKMTFRKKLMVAWVGLRGAAPIILATFPLLAGIPKASIIFNVVFFVVISSVLIQGTSVPLIARLLKVNAPFKSKKQYPIEFEKTETIDAELTDVIVPYNSESAGKTVSELGVPDKCLIVLVSRADKFVIPSGSTVLEGGDVLLVLANVHDLSYLEKALGIIQKKLGTDA